MFNWTPETDALARTERVKGKTYRDIGNLLAAFNNDVPVHEDAVRRRLRGLPLAAMNEAERALRAVRGEGDQLGLDLPVRPFEPTLPLMYAVTDSTENFSALLLGDMHAGFHDPVACTLAEAIARDAQPDVIVNMGDGVDCYQISKYDRDKRRAVTLQQDIDAARSMWFNIRNATPNSAAFWLEGNHENRLAKMWGRVPDLAAQVLMLRNVQRELDWPLLLDVDGVGTTWVPVEQQPAVNIVPKIILEHGSVVRSEAGVSGQYEMRKFGRSGASGHTHRLASFKRRDLNGVATWIETGCLCLLDGQPYGRHFNWQHGVVHIEWNPDRKLMTETLIGLRDGRAFWRSREYAA